ncbi:MAG: hypothetical protein GVY17_13295 [Cyanobacteria bacterium]|jgi:hypothetical protein|nr:hypothetical protein [Cyanobacteria bacterium GSL.Bin21]
MLDQEGIKHYVKLYKDILKRYKITISDEDINNIYQIILLTFQLDDLYDSFNGTPNPVALEKIRQSMISLMPNCHPIAMNAIDLVFKAMSDEAQSDLSQSLTNYLNVCGQSIGAQLVISYLASKENISLKIWFSEILVNFNDEINDLIRLANDYLDITVDVKRMSEEVSQIKAIHFFKNKFHFKCYLSYRYLIHKIRYYLYLISFSYLTFSAQSRNYRRAINCSESVLELAVKAYLTDQKSGRVSREISCGE